MVDDMRKTRRGHPSPKKGKTYEEMYGIERAKEIKETLVSKGQNRVGYWKDKKRSPETVKKIWETRRKNGTIIPHNKGKTNIELYGEERAKQLSKDHSEKISGGIPHNKGKTDVELYGKEKALELRVINSEFRKGTLIERYGEDRAVEIRGRLSKSLKGKLSGDKNPQWRGGISKLPYSFDFDNDLKLLIRRRDNHVCQMCKVEENGQGHDVHHIDYDKLNSEKVNLIALCRACHIKTNFDRKVWKVILTEYQVYRLGEIL